jgi:NAD/NADP transhydrogenase beta subunit
LQAGLGALLGVGLVGLLVPVLRESSTSFPWEPVVAVAVVLGVMLVGVGSSLVPVVQASRERISQNLGEG